MKKTTLTLAMICAATAFAFAGTSTYSGKESQTVQQSSCPQWYADSEWNVSLWGTYAFSGDNNDNFNFNNFRFNNGEVVRARALIGDHAWGGGIDAKYFFGRYFGLGVEGFGLSTGNVNNSRINRFARNNFIAPFGDDEQKGVGAALGTFTLRYPIQCSRIAPYVWGGIGGAWGGRGQIAFNDNRERFETEGKGGGSVLGQVGGGLEVRFTQHIGWMADVSWNITDDTNWGMVRTGVNFAF